ncbi:MAG: class I SAM-dependent methyltransferase [Lentisphaerae bacterium]|jgi:SAM-dependent methyltransferase|nr:class I SAM-dependent methyltransferase [Lentisphaerota bacterium]
MNISYTNELHAKYSNRTLASAEAILPLVLSPMVPESVVDVGCGHGWWLSVCLKLGVKTVLGLDGSYIEPSQMRIPPDSFQAMDLNSPGIISQKFDLAISVEVAEHLHPSSTGGYLDLLASLSDQILFSAAIPGQAGDAHVNARWPAFWINELEKRGFVALDFIRPIIWHNEEVALCYRQNILFFVSKHKYDSDPQLRMLPRTNCLHLIDEGILESLLGFRASLHRCMALLGNMAWRRTPR